VRQRFAPDKKQIADVVFDANIDHIPRLMERDRMPFPGIELIDGKPAKLAFGIADIGDRKLKIPRPAVIKHLAKKTERPLAGALWPD
jgi:hypothetical protein